MRRRLFAHRTIAAGDHHRRHHYDDACGVAGGAAPTTLTGTWGDGFSTISLTQNGSSLTGAQAPYMLDVFGGMAIFSGSVAGSASGANVTMTLQISVTVRAFGDSLTCRGADSFAGQVSGNTMTGTYTPNSSPYVCEGGVPLSLPPLLSGTRVYTRQ